MQRAFIILLTLICLIGCTKEPEPATPITWDQIDRSRVNTRVSLEGYITLPSSVMATDTLLLPLRQNLEEKEPVIRCSTKIGNGKNRVEAFPKKYTEDDFKLRDNTGELVPLSSKVRISGKLIGSPGSFVLFGPLVIERL